MMNEGVFLVLLAAAYCCCVVSGCKWRQDGSEQITDCERQLLTSIPDEVSDYTTQLMLNGNRISNISYNDMLSRFFNLKVGLYMCMLFLFGVVIIGLLISSAAAVGCLELQACLL